MASRGEELPGLTWRQRQRFTEIARMVGERALRREAMVNWLAAIGFEWFVTFTFRERVTSSGKKVRPGQKWAEKLLHAAIEKLNRRLFGKRYGKRGQGLLVVLCWELHKDGHPHAHALIRGCLPEVDYRFLKEWFHRELGICRAYPVKPGDGSARYVTKYVTKRGQDAFWEVLGPTAPHPAGPLFKGRAPQG